MKFLISFISITKGVGKTSIANRLVHNYFTEQYIETASDIRWCSGKILYFIFLKPKDMAN